MLKRFNLKWELWSKKIQVSEQTNHNDNFFQNTHFYRVKEEYNAINNKTKIFINTALITTIRLNTQLRVINRIFLSVLNPSNIVKITNRNSNILQQLGTEHLNEEDHEMITNPCLEFDFFYL